MQYGKLVYCLKTRAYVGRSQITYKALYHVRYCLFFYKEEDYDKENRGYIAGIPYTTEKRFSRKSEANKFAKEYGYTIDEWK